MTEMQEELTALKPKLVQSKAETEAMIHENPTLAMPIAKRQKLSES